MKPLLHEVKAAPSAAPENVILLDLRKKGLIENNAILKPLNGLLMSNAKDEWFESNVGQSCLQPEILYNPKDGLKYLKERLEAAFIAGATASFVVLNADDETQI